VRAVEFRPGNWKVVHHAFFKFDPTRESRRRDDADPEPGFEGIHAALSAQPPPGHFLSWQPGKIVSTNEDGLAWRLEAGSDLVIEMHLRPTGKPEQLQSEVGFYFTDQAPSKTPLKIWLNSYAMDIPPGKKDFVLEQSYRLPADADVLAVLPHAHYLGKQLQARVTLPDGTKKWLIDIKEWDFNWQGDYRYAHPLFLPEGTIIEMRYTYDNSADNPRNQRQPPQRVRYGLQSSDEMGELWLQLLPRTAEGLTRIRHDSESRLLEDSIAYNQYLLRLDPRDAKAAVAIGRAMLLQGRAGEAVEQFQKAAQMQPGYDEPHYYLGVAFRVQNKIDPARTEFETALRLNPGNSKAHGNLGMIFAEQGDAKMAESHFRDALRIDPGDSLARNALDELLKTRPNPALKK
jgi:tetratricopeptide (TPR) repeat protein